MNKTLKKGLIIGLSCFGGLALLVGTLFLIRALNRGEVNVYAVSDVSEDSYWMDAKESYGPVSTDRVQTVYLSDTQKVTDVFVENGQVVHAGDKLIGFDTTLSEIDLSKAQIALTRLKLQYSDCQKALAALYAEEPYKKELITPEPKGIEYIPQTTPMRVSGAGTETDPLYVLWGQDDLLSADYLQTLFAKPASEQEAKTCYVAFVTREFDALNAKVQHVFGMALSYKDDLLQFRLIEPNLPAEVYAFEAEEEPYYQETGTYTEEELARMIDAKRKELQDCDIQVKMAEVEYNRFNEEVSDGIVRAKFDGVIKELNSAEDVYGTNTPLVVLSGGGGYYIDVTMTEADIFDAYLGQEVEVRSWNTGETFTGTISEISYYPIQNGDMYGYANPNDSAYPFRVFVDESAYLPENEYVSVTYSNAASQKGLYLQNMFLRTEGSTSYVYALGADGLLEKRIVTTGKSLWGSSTQIRSGLTMDDYVAFPYGNHVTDGAKTRIAPIDELYLMAYN